MHSIISEWFFEQKFTILIKTVFSIKPKLTTPTINKTYSVYKLTSIRDYVYQGICFEYVNYLG